MHTDKKKLYTWVFGLAILAIIVTAGLCWLFPRFYVLIIPVVTLTYLIVLWIKNPENLIVHFFGKDPQERTNAKILKYIGVIVGSVIVILNLLELTETNKINSTTNQINKKGQLDTRFKDAATLLGSDNTSSMIAGVYALHQIARESAADENQTYYPSIIADIFCSTIREQFALVKDENDSIIPPARPIIVAEIILQSLSDSIYFIPIDGRYMQYNLDLRGVNLSGVNLSFVNLSFVNLNHVDLSFADLTYARLNYINLDHVDLSFADLTSARLNYVNLDHANLTCAILESIDLNDAVLMAADFTKANLNGANLNGGIFSDTNFIEADLIGTNLAEANLIGANLTKANLMNANLTNASLFHSNLTEANLTAANLMRANLMRANLTRANLTRADLREVNLRTTILHETRFDSTILEKYSYEEIRTNRNLTREE